MKIQCMTKVASRITEAKNFFFLLKSVKKQKINL